MRLRRLLLVASGIAFASIPFAVSLASNLSPESPPAPQRAAASPVLEPSTLILVGLGLVGIAIFRSRANSKS